jgi:hypothetical protein
VGFFCPPFGGFFLEKSQMAEPEGSAGQAASPDSAGATEAAPSSSPSGQSAETVQTTGAGSGTAEDSFFDPKSLDGKPELQAAYKQMQGSYTKKMQAIKKAQQKVDAYDAFSSNPLQSIHQIAQQYGYSLVQGKADAEGKDEGPQTWDDVYSRAKSEVMNELKPLLSEFQVMKQQNIEQYLDNQYSDWRMYEDEMIQNLKNHPSLSSDPDTLYRLSVPQQVLEARAQKAAMARLKSSSDAGQIAGKSSSSKASTEAELPKGGSFNDFVAYAKAKLAKQGLTG